MLDPSAHELLADGYVMAGPAEGARIVTAGYLGNYQTVVSIPRHGSRVWAIYRDRAAALYGDEACRSWAIELTELPEPSGAGQQRRNAPGQHAEADQGGSAPTG